MQSLRDRTAVASEAERQSAAEASAVLERLSAASEDVRLQVRDLGDGHPDVQLPAPAVTLLRRLLQDLAAGQPVSVLPRDAHLSTQEAADLLNVSRPFLVGLLEAGKIPYSRLGTHRRILSGDLMDFKAGVERAQREAFRSLTEEAQELGLGY